MPEGLIPRVVIEARVTYPSDIKPIKDCKTYLYRDCVGNLTSEVFFFKCSFSGRAGNISTNKKV
jgi:hypothetical protein